MELISVDEVYEEVKAIDVGTGFIPEYKYLKMLLKDVTEKDYVQEDYIKQFTLRVPENLSKIDRIIKIYNDLNPGVPDILFEILKEQKIRLENLKNKKGEYISPFSF